MIVKIWPIKGDQGTNQCKLYIEDEQKVIQIVQNEEGLVTERKIINPEEEFQMNADQYFIENEEDIHRVFEYMANEDKTKAKYVSGYMCDPRTMIDDFRANWIDIKADSSRDDITGKNETMSFHLVQSFPEDLNISDEEIHQCGIELLKKLENHQGIVCSHVHPVIDEAGEVHGKCKHNHILINAFMQKEKIDPKHPDRMKYHDCKETYEQLQIWNDEIAIEHGLPIIVNPDLDKVYSWKENYETKAGRSWKERIRLDIDMARRNSNNWDEFISQMQDAGYQIREGKHVTYTAPDGEHKVRGHILGQQYTKDNLKLYWTLRDRIEIEADRATRENEAPPLSQIAKQFEAPLVVDIPLGRENDRTRQFYPLSLIPGEKKREVLNTYFFERDLYDVKNADGEVVITATGSDIVNYLCQEPQRPFKEYTNPHKTEEQTSHHKKEEQQQQTEDAEAERRAKAEEKKRRQEYYESKFRNTRTGRRYNTELYDEKGRRRTSLELIFLIAIVVLRNESDLWKIDVIPSDKQNEPCFGPPDWKIQNMMDSLYVAEKEGLESPFEVDERVNELGAAYSRARAALSHTRRSWEKMKNLAAALDEYDAVREVVEKINELPEGSEKEEMKQRYASELERYKKAKAVMYGYKVTTPEEIADFQKRYEDIKKNLPEMEERLEKAKEDYRQIKKLQYHMNLAQNELYCYGPAYEPEKAANRGDLGDRISDKEFEEQSRD